MSSIRRTLLFAVLAACSSEANVDCPPETLNVDGLCRPRCAGPADCLVSELCSGGVCVPDDGASDAGPIPQLDAGTTCMKDPDCGPTTFGPWSACSGFSDICDESGRQERELFEPKCRGGVCQLERKMDRIDCTVPKTGEECAPAMLGEWSECNFENECTTAGEKKRDNTTFQCGGGSCVPNVMRETARCMRQAPAGDPCAPYEDTVVGTCELRDICANTGIALEERRQWRCTNAGTCEPRTVLAEGVMCPRPMPTPDGTPCAMGHQCCQEFCVAMDSPFDCGVCGNACAPGRSCVTLPASSGAGPYYTCGCESVDQCLGYGAHASCVQIEANAAVCTCSCEGSPSPCANQCVSGSCYELQLGGVCSYP